MQEDDLAASTRLREAVTEAYGKPGKVRNDNQLSKTSGVARTTLKGYLWGGVQPSTENMRDMAESLGVPAANLWLRWLGYEVPDAGLTRIANEISDLRAALLKRASPRAVAAERQDWESEPDRDGGADDEPPAEPGRRPA